jgi:DNA-binding NarL/FixJ family response regulator
MTADVKSKRAINEPESEAPPARRPLGVLQPELARPLTAKQERLLVLLLAGMDVARMGRELGVSQRSVYRMWKRMLDAHGMQNAVQIGIAYHEMRCARAVKK